MTDFLIRCFIKNYDQTQNPDIRSRYGVLSGIVGIILNLCLFTAKLVAGIFTSSISIIADAFNNLSDAGSSVVTFLGFKLAQRPADDEHPFGHGRYEYVTGLGISVAILLVGVELLKSSFEKIISAQQQTTFELFSICILAAAILVKLWMFFFNRKLSKKIDSSTIKATAMDSLSDVAATSIVFIGLLITRFIPTLHIDGYLGLLVAAFILYTGIQTARDSLTPLLGKAPDPEFVKQIKELVLTHQDIIGIHDLIIHDYGPGRCIVSLHAEVPSDADILQMHDSIDIIELELRQKFHCTATIHMDPVDIHDPFTENLRQTVTQLVSQVGEELSIHDFRIVHGQTHVNLIFDVAVPHQYKKTDAQIAAEIRKKVQEYNPTYFAVIQVEKLYLDTSKQY